MAEKERREGASPEWLRRWKAAHRTEKRAWRRSAPVDTDAKLQLFRVPKRGMRLLLVNSPAGEGELQRQLASALVELWGRHSTEPRQRRWCRRAAWPALVLGLGTRDRRERRCDGGRPRPLLKRSLRGEVVLAWGRATRRRGWGGVPVCG
jgi:hypothetical protein